MALDEAGEKFTPTDQQVSDKNPRFLGEGYTPETGRGANFVSEAPIDGQPYARQDSSWIRLEDTVPPFDDKYYLMRNGEWVEAVIQIDISARDIKVDPPINGKNNLQELLEVLAATSEGEIEEAEKEEEKEEEREPVKAETRTVTLPKRPSRR